MIFTINRRFASSSEPPIHYVESPAMTFSNRYRAHVLQQMQVQKNKEVNTNNQQTQPVQQNVDPKKKPMKWGEPTWFLFHTLAEKIKPEFYADLQKELLNLIYTICSNLPCPTCAKHATQYMNTINFNTLTTKESLKLMLHRFHNEVNRKKGFAEFPLDELDKKYSAANTVNIIHNFIAYFEDRSSNMRLIADNLHRSRVVLQIKAWFNKNIGCFEL